MASLKTFLILFAPLSALAAPQARAAPKDIRVVWTYHKAGGDQSGKTTLMAFRTDLSTLLEKSYSNTLNTGNFADTPLTFDVDENGFGTLTYGTTYKVHSDPEYSGGISCSQMYNEKDTFVECTVPWKGTSAPAEKSKKRSEWAAELGASSLPVLGQQGLDIWHASEPVAGTDSDPAVDPPTKRELQARPLGKRQSQFGCFAEITRETTLRGDGNPHQNHYNRQLSSNMVCSPQHSCEVSYTVQEITTIVWSVGITGPPPFAWISGGFAVEKSYSTGEAYTCQADNGAKVCVWENIAHTAYTVDNWQSDDICTPKTIRSQSVIKSPNQGNRGGGYYCVVGENNCRHRGAGYWGDSRNDRPGGPPPQ